MVLFIISTFFSSYFILGYIWKYLENEYGILASSIGVSIIVFTSYGIYIYIRKSLYNELKIGNLIVENSIENQKKKKLSISERYYEERQKCLNSEKISNSKKRIDNEQKKSSTDIHTKVIVQEFMDNLKPEHLSSHEGKLSFFGIGTTTPIKKSVNNEIFRTNTQKESCSPSMLASMFIRAASIAKNFQDDANSESNNSINTPYLQNKLNYQNQINLTKSHIQIQDSSKNQIINSIKSSLHSNIKTAKNKFGDYISSLQGSKSKERRNSFPSNFPLNISNGNQKNMNFNTIPSRHIYKHNLIQLLEDPMKDTEKSTLTPTKKIYQGFSSPLPTGKSSPILLLSEKNQRLKT